MAENMSEKVKGVISGLLFSVMMYLSSFFGVVYLAGPFLPLMFFNGRMYRKMFDYALHTWLILPGVSIRF